MWNTKWFATFCVRGKNKYIYTYLYLHKELLKRCTKKLINIFTGNAGRGGNTVVNVRAKLPNVYLYYPDF